MTILHSINESLSKIHCCLKKGIINTDYNIHKVLLSMDTILHVFNINQNAAFNNHLKYFFSNDVICDKLLF